MRGGEALLQKIHTSKEASIRLREGGRKRGEGGGRRREEECVCVGCAEDRVPEQSLPCRSTVVTEIKGGKK